MKQFSRGGCRGGRLRTHHIKLQISSTKQLLENQSNVGLLLHMKSYEGHDLRP